MALSSSEYALYRDLLTITSNEKFNSLITQYANIHYARAAAALRSKKDPVDIYRAQGELAAWERIINMNTDILSILKNAE